MLFKLWIARRYLFSRNVGRFGPLMSVVAIAGIALSTASLIVVLSVMRGFDKELVSKLIGFGAHISMIAKESSAKATPLEIAGAIQGAAYVIPYVQGEVIARPSIRGSELASGAKVRGVGKDWFARHEKLKLSLGENVSQPRDRDLSGILAGVELAALLQVHPAFEDKLELIAPLADVGPTGELVPTKAEFPLAGVFKSGVLDYDSKVIFLSIDSARALLGQQAEEGYQIMLSDAGGVKSAVSQLRTKFPSGWKIFGFDEENQKLFAALKLERVAMGAVLLMALIISSLATAGVVMLVTAAKRKDVAVLQTVGLSRRDCANIFTLNAALISLCGSAMGCLIGMTVSLLLEARPLALPSSYYLDTLPVEASFPFAFALALLGVVISVVASRYPVRSATRAEVSEVLRYE